MDQHTRNASENLRAFHRRGQRVPINRLAEQQRIKTPEQDMRGDLLAGAMVLEETIRTTTLSQATTKKSSGPLERC